ncbi:probable disease resistance protein At4g27220 [Prosopis cineraria]|uniref:probable disease resistance protein At4g27220 n=1 Tax=Prosopis cineraria TaxID=364024 RepID=UPI0024107632|nr:probable disease resistance protein At4g27220 [Prosopis cineraria]
MEFVSSIFGVVLDVMVQPVGRQWVREAEWNAHNIEEGIKNWLNEVDEKIKEIDGFVKGEDHQKTGCSNGSFPNNLRLRHKIGRKAKKMIPQCDKLLERGKFERISYLPKHEASNVALRDSGYEPLQSRDDIVKKVMNALRDPTTKMAGIYGQGGIGKTTLVKEVVKKAKEKKLFNVVVMANITSTPDIRNIQGEIADMLGLRLDAIESVIGRAGRLQQRFEKEKENTLVILDDLWAEIDLSKLGILLKEDDVSQMIVKDMSDVHDNQFKQEKSSGDFKSCKILLISRSEGVLRQMDVKEDQMFLVEVVNEKEAETLFNKIVGISENSELKSMSTEIVNNCAKLPMAIVTAGKALKNIKNKVAWQNALKEMKRHGMIQVMEPMEFSTKLSYDNLQSEELKSFFLLCAYMSKDPTMMDLVRYCIGLNIFQGVYTVEEARGKTITLINMLKGSSLLLDTLSSNRITMHDMVRDAALSIAFKEKHVFTMRMIY